ncbi:MAG: type II toxin-antitoxin system YafQ family toxin [Deltaproteobacteria bacterium]|nr:type II toxin-antitoxin system YafQ family toxin [Deltaproteobacteria bacterium]
MKRLLIRSPAFVRAAKRSVKRHPDAAEDIRTSLELLAEDATHPKLKTHRLKGKLEGSWACSAGYDLRIIFRLGQYEDQKAVFLETIGTHDEVY